jgi:hypothetical protein
MVIAFPLIVASNAISAPVAPSVFSVINPSTLASVIAASFSSLMGSSYSTVIEAFAAMPDAPLAGVIEPIGLVPSIAMSAPHEALSNALST